MFVSQILGFDILLMKNLKPVLLEVNSNPSMRIEHEQEVIEYFITIIKVFSIIRIIHVSVINLLFVSGGPGSFQICS